VEFPLGGRDDPGTLREFNAWFGEEEACMRYLAGLRWRGGFICAVCGGERAWRMSKGRNLRCARCRSDHSVTAGTIFADTRLPLTIWFAAAWYVTGTKHGVSALGLQRLLGLGSYETAWALLHKLRRAMVRPGRDRLSGEIEVDETAIGPSAPGRLGRGTFVDRAIIAVAVEARPRGACGRVRLARIADCSGPVLTAFVTGAAAPGTVVYTDRWLGYAGLGAAGFISPPDQHRRQRRSRPRRDATRPSRLFVAQTLAARHPPGCGSAAPNSTSTSTSSRSASTAAARANEAFSSTDCSSKQCRSTTYHVPQSSAAAHDHAPNARGVIGIPRLADIEL
jgi:hypothetical protein